MPNSRRWAQVPECICLHVHPNQISTLIRHSVGVKEADSVKRKVLVEDETRFKSKKKKMKKRRPEVSRKQSLTPRMTTSSSSAVAAMGF